MQCTQKARFAQALFLQVFICSGKGRYAWYLLDCLVTVGNVQIQVLPPLSYVQVIRVVSEVDQVIEIGVLTGLGSCSACRRFQQLVVIVEDTGAVADKAQGGIDSSYLCISMFWQCVKVIRREGGGILLFQELGTTGHCEHRPTNQYQTESFYCQLHDNNLFN